MRGIRTRIYAKVNAEKHEIVYSGIEFAEFIKYLSYPIENLLLLKANYVGNRSINNFELVEGRHSISKFSKEDIYNYGDFCFVDYACSDGIARLTGEQISELLYMAHMFEPLKSPFFDLLKNRFAYLTHDDGFYCKLFSKNLDEFMLVICSKITANINTVASNPSDIIKSKLLNMAEKGILIDLEELSYKKGSMKVNIYQVGEYLDMDIIQNSLYEIEGNALKICSLHYNEKEWNIT